MLSQMLNRVGELYAVTETSSDAGEPTEVTTLVCKAALQFVSANGNEFMAARQLNAEVTHVIRMRYMPNVTVTPNHILKYDSRTFRFLSVIDEREYGRTLLISAVEDVSETV